MFVCDVISGWLPPQPIKRLNMVLGQLFITDLTLSKRRLNEGIYKTLHNQAFAYYHKRSSICMLNYDITVAMGRGALHFLKLQLTVQVLH